MDRNVVILLVLPLVAIASEFEEEMEHSSFQEDIFYGGDCLQDVCPSDYASSMPPEAALARDTKIYESMTKDERRFFRSREDVMEEIDSGLTPQITYGKNVSDKNKGLHNIIANYPQYREDIETRIKPMLSPEMYSSLTLVNGCCPEFHFLRREIRKANIYTEFRTLVHFTNLDPPQYQYFYLGLCAHEKGLFGDNGHCRQGFVNSMHLVYTDNKKTNFAFDLFRVEAFCKCFTY